MNSDSFTSYYQDELLAIRKDAYQFGKRHENLAPQLGVEWGANPDPMVERLIESLAWFAARIRRDSEEKLPSAAQQVLRRICPGLVRPVPSIGIVSLTPVEGLSETKTVPAGSRFHCEGACGEIIRWRTAWPVTLSGARVTWAGFSNAGDCDIPGLPFDRPCFRLDLSGMAQTETFRLFLKGDPFSTHPLHEWVHTNLMDVYLTSEDGADKTLRLGKDALRPGGLAPEDLVLPRSEYAHPSYQLAREYFACPERFLFWDFTLPVEELGKESVSIVIPLRLPPPDSVSAEYVCFDPFAVPVVNLFERTAEPIGVDHTRHCYPLEADRSDPDATQVYSVLGVEALFPAEAAITIPYYGEPITGDELGDSRRVWRWYDRRRESVSENGTDIDLFFKCLDQRDLDYPFTAAVRTLCSNRDKASALGNNTRLHNDDEMPILAAIMERPPTRQWEPVLSGEALWRLVSSMSLHLKALSGAKGLECLQEILRLYCPADSHWALTQMDGLGKLLCEDTLAPLRATRERPMGGAARGHHFSLWLDKSAFRNTSPFLFASVVEAFLALFAGINSFTRLTAYLGGNTELYAWPARSGSQRL